MFKKLLLLGLSGWLILGAAGLAEAKDNPIQALIKIILGGPKPRPVDGSRDRVMNCLPYSADGQPIALYTRSPLLVWQGRPSLLTLKTSNAASENYWSAEPGPERCDRSINPSPLVNPTG